MDYNFDGLGYVYGAMIAVPILVGCAGAISAKIGATKVTHLILDGVNSKRESSKKMSEWEVNRISQTAGYLAVVASVGAGVLCAANLVSSFPLKVF